MRLIFRLAWEGDGTSGPMGVKSITTAGSEFENKAISAKNSRAWGAYTFERQGSDRGGLPGLDRTRQTERKPGIRSSQKLLGSRCPIGSTFFAVGHSC